MSADRPRLGYIGIGLMGTPMVLRLLDAGYEVSVWNRSAQKLEPVVAKGAVARDSAAAVVRNADIVMMCLTDQDAVEAVVFGPAGIAEGGDSSKLLVDFSSIAPTRHREMARRLHDAVGMGWLDSPVSGGVPGAEAGTLAVMAGGTEEDFARAAPVVTHLSARFTHMGGPGAGQVAKLLNQVIVSNTIAVLAEVVALAERAGVDATRLPEALKGGWADSLPFQLFVPRMAHPEGQTPLGVVNTMRKDLENARDFAAEIGLRLPMTDHAGTLYQKAANQGLGEEQIEMLVALHRASANKAGKGS